MQPEFWHKRWTSNQIGFHLPEVNPYLQRYWPQLGLEEGARTGAVMRQKPGSAVAGEMRS